MHLNASLGQNQTEKAGGTILHDRILPRSVFTMLEGMTDLDMFCLDRDKVILFSQFQSAFSGSNPTPLTLKMIN